jgi:hypothetical protein
MAENFYLAWIDEGETFDETVHNREDEDVFSFQLEQSEGDFATLSLEIRNPRIGLLAPGRKQWCFFAFNDNGVITPLFKGRLVGIPSNVFDTLVTLSFIARPSDYDAQKLALAETLKELPYYDPIFISPDNWGDPDVVLEAYDVLWHIDPVTHEVTVSNVIIPEDGVVEVTDDQHFYDEMSVTLNQTPLRRCQVIATIPWTQTDDAGNSIDLSNKIKQAFGADVNGMITSFTMSGLIDDWPKQGDKFSNGWVVKSGELTDVSFSIPIVPIPDIFSWQGTIPRLPQGSIVYPLKVTGEYHAGEKAGFNFQFELVVVQKNYAVPSLKVAYTASREFAQTVSFTLETDQQSIITAAGEDEVLTITLNANKVSDISEFGDTPIEDVRRRDYVHTARGLLSCKYLLLVARAHLIARSRAVETTYQQGFKAGLAARSLRKAGLLHDHRLPGGAATGKIVKYTFSLSGDDGSAIANITIASCIGKGGTPYSNSVGDPNWVDEGWVDREWQEYVNQIIVADTEDVSFSIPGFVPFDDGLDFIAGLTSGNAVKVLTIENSAAEQEVALLAASAGPNTDQSAISSVLQTIPTKITAQLVPMEGGPYKQEVVISVSDLIVPKQIDLEAPSNA